MPYINQTTRKLLDGEIDKLIIQFDNFDDDEIEGVLNYTISRILSAGIKSGHNIDKWRYYLINRAIGVLECVKQEFYRRIAAPYETQAMNKNLDIKEYVGKKHKENTYQITDPSYIIDYMKTNP